MKLPTRSADNVILDADDKWLATTPLGEDGDESLAAEISAALNERAELRAELELLRMAIIKHGYVIDDFVRSAIEQVGSMKDGIIARAETPVTRPGPLTQPR